MNKQLDWALLVLRVALGLIFIVHGSQKLFSFGFAGVAGFLSSLGVPLPNVFAVIVTLVEFGGGILIFLGLLTRLAAFFILINMLVAFFRVHLAHGFFLPQGFEFVLLILGVTLALLLAGSGKFSVDAFIFRKKEPAST